MNPILAFVLVVGTFGTMGTLMLLDVRIKWKRLKEMDANRGIKLFRTPGIVVEAMVGSICILFVLLQIINAIRFGLG